jgi:hypothetical protein
VKSGSSSGEIGYFVEKLEGMASGDEVPVSILYVPESLPLDVLVKFIQVETPARIAIKNSPV